LRFPKSSGSGRIERRGQLLCRLSTKDCVVKFLNPRLLFSKKSATLSSTLILERYQTLLPSLVDVHAKFWQDRPQKLPTHAKFWQDNLLKHQTHEEFPKSDVRKHFISPPFLESYQQLMAKPWPRFFQPAMKQSYNPKSVLHHILKHTHVVGARNAIRQDFLLGLKTLNLPLQGVNHFHSIPSILE
jgi:hypothetical protein